MENHGEKKKCSYEGCDRPSRAKGWCSGHYRLAREGAQMRPLHHMKRYTPPAPGKKICTVCERVLDAEKNFYLNSEGRRKSWCKECCIRKQKEYTAKRKESGGND